MNSGKQFEADFIGSVPSTWAVIRLKDSPGAWGSKEEGKEKQSSPIRFTSTNICDSVLFNGSVLLPIELKSHKGKSITKKAIRKNQIDGLYKLINKPNVYAGLIFNFADLNETYFVHIKHVQPFYYQDNPKSFPIAWIKEHGILIPQAIKIKHYKYDLSVLISELGA